MLPNSEIYLNISLKICRKCKTRSCWSGIVESTQIRYYHEICYLRFWKILILQSPYAQYKSLTSQFNVNLLLIQILFWWPFKFPNWNRLHTLWFFSTNFEIYIIFIRNMLAYTIGELWLIKLGLSTSLTWCYSA